MSNKYELRNNIFEQRERVAYGYFTIFCFIQNWTNYRPSEPKERYDATVDTEKSKNVIIELKVRNKVYNDIFIEPKKYELLNSLEHAYYINFVENYKEVYIYSFPKDYNYNFYPNVTITHQDGEQYTADRYGLKLEDAYHLILNENTKSYENQKRTKTN